MIPNHVAAPLSALDRDVALAVPPGGNWRNIPLNIPSKRLDQIRISAAAGEGSRSTYYGRLHPDRPSYTINTYYSRPGNGCHLHYDAEGNQHRTLSHREAARLQSFPDSFRFMGSSQRAIAQQIGNAVPPLLAFQLARELGPPGKTIDVFAGAGGLSLGFKWAGWSSIAALDIDRHSIDTFNLNVAPVGRVGDMNDDAVLHDLARLAAGDDRRFPLALIGGPPCQGFSTGGNRRSVDDQRNWLFDRYARLVELVRPDYFVFENVLGLLSMDRGAFVQGVLTTLQDKGYSVSLGRLNAADFSVPQRRHRVFILGVPKGRQLPSLPRPWSTGNENAPLARGILPTSVREALGDLPPIEAGEDGSSLTYRSTADDSIYQMLMRGVIEPHQYISQRRLGRNDPDWQPPVLHHVIGTSGPV